MTAIPAARAHMASRKEPPDSLEFMPTPPWATRTLIREVLVPRRAPIAEARVWEPAAGQGHMAEVLREFFADVYASDVFDYGVGYPSGSFIAQDDRHAGDLVGDLAQCPFRPDWIVTNPPFSKFIPFVLRALREASQGVALFLPTRYVEGGERSGRGPLFATTPPAIIAQFIERVPCHKGRWDPGGSTATAYCWMIWAPWRQHGVTEFTWIAEGAEARNTRDDDVARFAGNGGVP